MHDLGQQMTTRDLRHWIVNFQSVDRLCLAFEKLDVRGTAAGNRAATMCSRTPARFRWPPCEEPARPAPSWGRPGVADVLCEV